MARSNPELWRRLAAFEVSPEGALFGFTKRLARENQWPLAFARRVFDEYRRFLYLSVVAGGQLAPADAVARTWQLHLSYRASYGQVLCGSVLGQALHYEPADGEAAAREARYRATLAAYEQEFGCAPPAEIWPAAPQVAQLPPANRRRRTARKARQRAALALIPAANPA